MYLDLLVCATDGLTTVRLPPIGVHPRRSLSLEKFPLTGKVERR